MRIAFGPQTGGSNLEKRRSGRQLQCCLHVEIGRYEHCCTRCPIFQKLSYHLSKEGLRRSCSDIVLHRKEDGECWVYNHTGANYQSWVPMQSGVHSQPEVCVQETMMMKRENLASTGKIEKWCPQLIYGQREEENQEVTGRLYGRQRLRTPAKGRENPSEHSLERGSFRNSTTRRTAIKSSNLHGESCMKWGREQSLLHLFQAVNQRLWMLTKKNPSSENQKENTIWCVVTTFYVIIHLIS